MSALRLTHFLPTRHPPQGRMDTRRGLPNHRDQQHNPRGDVHLLDDVRLHRADADCVEARVSCTPRGPEPHCAAHLRRRADLLHHSVSTVCAVVLRCAHMRLHAQFLGEHACHGERLTDDFVDYYGLD